MLVMIGSIEWKVLIGERDGNLKTDGEERN
jgi:hypothetical protein